MKDVAPALHRLFQQSGLSETLIQLADIPSGVMQYRPIEPSGAG
jgi:hypothetical protein